MGNPKQLYKVIDNTPIIDHHAHPLLKASHLSRYPLESIASEAGDDALQASWSSLAHIRATQQLASSLGCAPDWTSVKAAIAQKQSESPNGDVWARKCMRGIATVLIDDGLGMHGETEEVLWHDQLVTSPCKRIIRIEAVATDFIYSSLSALDAKEPKHSSSEEAFGSMAKKFTDLIHGALGNSTVVGFKSIICYRGGLDVPYLSNATTQAATLAFKLISEDHLSGKEKFLRLNQACPARNDESSTEDPFERAHHRQLLYYFLWRTAVIISECEADKRKPIQFHTGLGDNDITLAKSSPSYLQTFIRQFPAVPIVLLHAGYPWTRETGYLATMYSNVYADIGEVFPFLSRGGEENVIKQILELCPWSKILWSTDGHWFPETYFLATEQLRATLRTVMPELVRSDQVTERQAIQLVQDILYNNANSLYKLKLEPHEVPRILENSSTMTNHQAPLTRKSPPEVVLDTLRSLDCKWLRLAWLDYTATPRCRLIPMKRALATLESGKPIMLHITKAALSMIQIDHIIPDANATGMYSAHPDWGSLKLGPALGHVSCMVEFREEQDDGETELCPRTVLRRTLDKAAGQGLTFLLGFEIEFCIMRRNPKFDSGHSEEKYIAPYNDDGHAWSTARSSAGIGHAGNFNSAIDEISDCLEAAGILIEQFHAENAPGQYEVVLPPLPPLEACDTLVHARHILEGVAARRGFHMTMHPKPSPMHCGTGSHMHMSVSSSGGDTPEVYEHVYAGILHHFQALLAFTYSSPVSYERMKDSAWAGGQWVMWGTQNKEAPLRKCKDSHWEVKAVDGLANPYFAAAAILSAGAWGVQAKQELTWKDCPEDAAQVTANGRGEEFGITSQFPGSLPEALRYLSENATASDLLGPAFVERYMKVKKAEISYLNKMGSAEKRNWIMDRY